MGLQIPLWNLVGNKRQKTQQGSSALPTAGTEQKHGARVVQLLKFLRQTLEQI